ncbi:MAG: hypothetical protein KA129_03850, partial [Microthrixaceae bacterium]|nr:hypothetical protein [Microthrixaceae bacterium]
PRKTLQKCLTFESQVILQISFRNCGGDLVTRAEDLRADYEALGEKLDDAKGSGAAALVRERRLISAELERLETPGVVPLVDQLAAKRAAAGGSRPASRRRKSG